MASRRIKPPFRAPYLNNVPSFEHVEAADLRMKEATRVFERLRQLIREAREKSEVEHDVGIEVD